MPLVQPLYDDIPPWAGVNYHDVALGKPEILFWPDYTLQIDGITGKKRSLHRFLERVADGATALGAPRSAGGLELQQSDGFVGIMSENCLDFPVLVFALLKLAIPISFIPSLLTPTESVALLRLSCATTLFVSPRLLPIALNAAKQTGLSEDRIFVLGGRVTGRKSLSDLIASIRMKSIPRIATSPVDRDTVAYMVFSSGTSGLPKGVLISHRNLYTSVAQLAATAQKALEVYQPPPWNTPEGIPVALVVLPFYHTMGLHTFIIRMISQQATYVLLPKWDANRVAEALSKYHVTHFSMVPSMAHQLATSPKLAKIDLSNLRSMNSGAAYLPPQIRQQLSERAKNVVHFGEGYGMSECTVAAVIQPFPGAFPGVQHTNGYTGTLLAGMKGRIVREDGSDAEFEEPGELLLYGDNIALGYHNNDVATRETFVDGWLHTGDRFKVDRSGRFFYVDRIKDTLKVSGTQVSPTEIESVILAHPERLVSDVTVAGVPGARMLDERVPRAWVVLSPDGQGKGEHYVADALESWVRARLSRPKWLRGGVQVVDEIPKLPTGKVLRRKLQEEYEEAALRLGRVRSKL